MSLQHSMQTGAAVPRAFDADVRSYAKLKILILKNAKLKILILKNAKELILMLTGAVKNRMLEREKLIVIRIEIANMRIRIGFHATSNGH